MMKFQMMTKASSKKHSKYSWLRPVIAFLFILPSQVPASPLPAMGSSALVSPSKGYTFNLRGFRLTKGQTNWNLEGGGDVDCCNNKGQEISVRYQSPMTKGFLAVKTETLSTPMNVEFFAKKWIRDYSYYGFDILGAKTFNQGNARGYVVDLFHSKKLKQMRQVVFLKEKTAVILTCSDDQSQFAITLSNCNSILKSFSWL